MQVRLLSPPPFIFNNLPLRTNHAPSVPVATWRSRMGTVDKFQGQEAPVVIYSMATSTPQDAPRRMEFLYSGNRLNVATSRAQCVTVLVASPRVVRCAVQDAKTNGIGQCVLPIFGNGFSRGSTRGWVDVSSARADTTDPRSRSLLIKRELSFS